MKRLFLVFSILVPVIAQSAPAILLGTGSGQPGEVVQININYDGNTSGVTRFEVEVAIDASLFSDITGLCPGSLFECAPSGRGTLIIRGDSQSNDELPSTMLGRMRLEIAGTTPPGNYDFPVISEQYFNASGGQVGGSGSSDGQVVVTQIPVAFRQSLSRSGEGGVLLFPYYSTQVRANTLFAVRNNSPMMKAVRVNVEEALNGRVVGAWNVYLSPGGVHRFQLDADSQTGGVIARADGCTVPEFPASGLPLDSSAYSSDGGPQAIERLREGTVSVVAMADIDPAVAMSLSDCANVRARFESTGVWTVDPTVDTVIPVGDLAGRASVRGLRQRPVFDFVPTAIRGYAVETMHRAPDQSLGFDIGATQAVIVSEATTQTIDFNTSVDAMSGLLMKQQTILPLWQRGTVWQFSFPTKPYYTDPMRAPFTPPVPPFTSVFGAGGACEPVEILPARVGAIRNLCFVANAVAFDSLNVLQTAIDTPPVITNDELLAGIAAFGGNGLFSAGGDVELQGLPVVGTAIPFRTDRAPEIRQLDLAGALLAKGPMDAGAGESVVVRGRLIFVGVPGANGGEGQVLVFRRHGTRLILEATIEAPPGTVSSELGAAMDFVDGQLAIGAPGDTTVLRKGGLPSLQGMIMERLEGVWNVKGSITDLVPGDAEFGASVAIENGLVAFGTPGDDTMGTDAGAVYLFDDSGNSIAPIMPTVAGPNATAGLFGLALSMKNGQMGVGSPGANGLQGAFTGAVTMFGDISNNLNPTSVQMGSNAGDGFGSSISLSGTMMAVGSPGADGEAGSAQGAVQTFDVIGGNLFVGQMLTSTSVGASGNFGSAVSMGNDQLVVGAPGSLGVGGVTGTTHILAFLSNLFAEDSQVSPENETIEGFGSSVSMEPEDGTIVVGAPDSGSNLGAVVTIADAEVLFFDDYETELYQ